jgi:hypothetical protein
MRTNVTRPARGHDVGVDLVESLERRMLMAAPHEFAGVGLRLDGGPAVFLVHGEIAGDDTMTGAMRSGSLGAGVTDAGLDWTRYVRGERGSFTFETRLGFTAYDQQSGSQFVREDRWSLGSFVGSDLAGNVRDWAVLSEVVTLDADLRNSIQPVFQMQMTHLTVSGTETFTLTVLTHPENPDDDTFTFIYALPGGDVTATKHVQSIDGSRITFATGEVMYLTGGHREGVLLADFDDTDGVMGIASGRQTDGTANGTIVNGRYGGAVLTPGPESRAFFGVTGSVEAADVIVDFQWHGDLLPGTFTVYDRAAFLQGDRTALNSGTWVIQLVVSSPSYYFVQLNDEAGRVVTAQGGPTRALWFGELNTPTDGHEELAGVVESQEFRAGDIQEVLAERDADGHAIAYVQMGTLGNPEAEEGIFSVDLVDEVGGEAVTGKLSVWWSQNGAIFIAGLSGGGDVQVWRWDGVQVGWRYQNLTDTVAGAVPIASHFAGSWYETGRVGSSALGGGALQALAGYDADGNFVAYRQVSASDEENIWEFDDTGVDGISGGPVPASVTEFTGYATNWNGHNFVGLDDHGQVWAVWWAPGLSQWQVTNLSAAYGIEELAGNIATMRTEWDTLHVIGTSAADGHLIVAWWAPGFSSWLSNDLTEEINGPVLQAGTLAAHFSFDLLTINFAGKDLAGNTRVYWWAPYTTWHAGFLAGAPQQTPDTPWQFTSAWWLVNSTPEFTRGHSQSLLGRESNGHLVRLVWSDTRADAWLYEDVSAVALSYFT